MAENVNHPVRIDLIEFKLHIHLKDKTALYLHFNTPSRKFYLSLIALVVMEMKKRGKIVPISLQEHLGMLALLNETVGGAAGSSEKENLLPRIYRKWKHALPNLEEAPLFKVQGKKKEYEGMNGKAYLFTEQEKDLWANLFAYIGSEENVRLKFAIDKIGGNLDDIVITYGELRNEEAWESFLAGLRGGEEKPESEPETPVLEEPGVQAPRVEESPTPWPNRNRRVAWMAAVLLVLAGVTWAIWKTVSKPAPLQVAAIERMAYPLPDKPSIAVLPFENLSGDPKQEFFSDGITQNIITGLSKIPRLFVIAQHSTLVYKGKKGVKVQQVAETLGVRYVLVGSVQNSGNRIRIAAQLIDALTGNHLWAEKYDRNLKDIFAVQDEITKEILTAFQVKLMEGEQARVWARGTNNLEAYLKFLKAYDQYKSFNKNSMILTRQICEEAIGIDPNYEAPYSLLGGTHLIDLWFHWGESPQVSMEKAIPLLQKAVVLRPTSDSANALLGHLYLLQNRYDESVKAGEKAIALNPNGDYNMVVLGITFNYVRRYEEAITLFREAQRRNPFCPAWYIHNAINSYHLLGKWDKAVAEGKRALEREPDHFPAMVCMAAVYGNSGRLDEGRAMAGKMLKIDPGFSLAIMKSAPFKYPSDGELIKAGLRKVGIPENPPSQ